jgi:hypothetical protein
MDDSLSEWLALREAADWASRADHLVQRVQRVLAPVPMVRGLDLCTGTGSNLRYVMDRLIRHQQWLAVDHDGVLLSEGQPLLSKWARDRGCSVQTSERTTTICGDRFECEIEMRQMDLAHLDEGLFEGRNIVTASALLDLVSETWLELLARRSRAARAVALFTLTYDGRSSCDPIEPEDAIIRELMNRHQRTDKGLGGRAAGPDAWSAAERIFEEAGYRVERASSDWSLAPSDRTFQHRLIEGWAHAAAEIAPLRADAIADWLRRRRDHVDAGRSRIVVNHADMVAWLE